MIGYLKGTIASVSKASNRVILTLDVNQVGYDLQIVPRMLQAIPEVGSPLQMFTYLELREN